MKKIIIIVIILLVMVSGISLFIGYNLEIISNKKENCDTTESYTETNRDDEGKPIEITLNNWQDYVELEDVAESNVDDFGETTSTAKYTIFKFKDSVIKSDNVRLKLKYNDKVSIGENWKEQILEIYDGSDDFKVNYKLNVKNKNAFGSKDYDFRISIDDFEVINAKGTVYVK